MDESISFGKWVFQDWAANPNSTKSRLVLTLFRLAQALTYRPSFFKRIFGRPYVALYTILVQWFLGIELPPSASVGKGLILFHGVGLVVHPATVIGESCVLRHCTTIGSKGGIGSDAQKAPVLGNCVDVVCNVVIIGSVSIGQGAVIGAGSVVLQDIPANSIVAGNPLRILSVRGVRSRNVGESNSEEINTDD